MAVAVLLFAYFARFSHHVSYDGSNRVKCASNLRQIGQAILLYANENHGHYPRTIYSPSDNTIPTWGTGALAADPFKADGPAPNDVTAALFLLMRTQDITSEVFTCPCSNAERFDFGGGSNTAANFSNWTDLKKNLSYSIHNPYPNRGTFPNEEKEYWTNQLPVDFAVASDLNPGTINGSNSLNVTINSPSSMMKKANSTNHEGDGQNVLFGDGHVEFTNNPLCGVNRDNIFLNRSGQFIGPPMDVSDSILLPVQ